ncbi:ergot alkaloid A [Aspergillus indologenus CBS 114.80]|uniref:Ergot alkaloid A n=1 Tax=Aspergillus indologenus CBS 114.80 TaxID=1450541 RepID=A0A2V5II50_9EURO|nr:ergot alkaloid A [Aspergillus indologenus CBS 114.80]
MTILVLGGRGKTASRLSALLHEAQIPFVVGTSSTAPIATYRTAHFDWLNKDTWTNAWDQAPEPITAIYLVGAHAPEFVHPMFEFIDLAHSRGVRRYALVSASNTEKGDPMMGEAHAHLDSKEGVKYVVLRPTWFMENHIEDPHLSWIKTENKIYSATGPGKIPFVSADDIARVAFHALTQPLTQKEQQYMVLGPDLLSYADMAEILTDLLGRKITHVTLPAEKFGQFLVDTAGLPPDFAEMLATMEAAVATGAEERVSQDVEKVTGRPPRRFVDYARENREHWL